MSAPLPPAGTDAAPSETLSYSRELSPDAGPSSPDGSGLARGSRVHRYTILDRVGEGGMGVVYAAYDPSLDRRVALKFLVPHDPARQSVREARLVREAQAMARLSHPNVAVVYEVGNFEGSVFLAMEFVDGAELRTWLVEEPRSRAQIMEVQNLSLLQSEIGDYEASARSARRGLAIRSKLFPPEHPEVATALANLAAVRMEEEKLDEAIALFERAAAIREEALGPENAQLATVRNHMAWMAVRLGNTAAARRLIDLVLPVKRKLHGDLHHSTGYAYSVLGFVLRQEGKLEEARAVHKKELLIKQGSGDDRSWSAEALDGLSAVALAEKKPLEAIEHLERARKLLEAEKADRTHLSRLLPVLTHLGRAQLAAGRAPEAVAILRRAIQVAETIGPAGVRRGARARFELARAVWSSGAHAQAIDLAREALDVLSRDEGSQHVDWITGRGELTTIKEWLRRHQDRR